MKVFPTLRFFVGLPFSLSVFMVFSAQMVSAQTDMFIYPGKEQNQAQQDKDRYECHSWAVQQSGFDPSKPQSANSQPSLSVRVLPLLSYKEPLEELRSERLAVRFRVTPARAQPPGQQWEAW